MGIWNSSVWEPRTAQCGNLEDCPLGIWNTVPLESNQWAPKMVTWDAWSLFHILPVWCSAFHSYIPPIQLGFSQQFRRTFRKICAKAKFYLRKIKADILQICLVRSSTDFYDEYHGNPSLSVQDEGQIKIYFRYHPKLWQKIMLYCVLLSYLYCTWCFDAEW